MALSWFQPTLPSPTVIRSSDQAVGPMPAISGISSSVPEEPKPFTRLRIAIVTDAWLPQINGVVSTLSSLTSELERQGHAVFLITPERFRTVPMPTYPEIRLSLASARAVGALLEAVRPDAIHIATEGPLGYAARSFCLKKRLGFTTAFHTKFPEYINARFGLPKALSYGLLRWFHAPASATMVASRSLQNELAQWGFRHLFPWTRGVDLQRFNPAAARSSNRSRISAEASWPRPISLYVGRLAVEKNLSAFLDLDLPGTKLLVGDGPQREALQAKYPNAIFTGKLHGQALSDHYAMSDVFVFPSLTDTFGVVILEAMASGLPVAAFPVCGPLDVVGDSGCGVLDHDLRHAILQALTIDRSLCRDYAATFSWQRSAQQFLNNLHPLR